MAGVHPSLLPGGRRFGVADERTEVENLWGPIIVGDEGRNWWGILEACAERDIDVLFLIGVDPLRDFPDAALATRALQNVDRVVVQSLELGSLEPFADAFLPAAAFLEKDGHVTTWEGPQPADPADPRRGRHRAPGLGDLREPGAWPRAAIWGSRRSTSSTRRWAGCWRRASDRRARDRRERARPAPGPRGLAPSLHVPVARRRGPPLRALRRAEGGAGGRAVPGDPPERRGAARRDRRRRASSCAPRPGRPSSRCA